MPFALISLYIFSSSLSHRFFLSVACFVPFFSMAGGCVPSTPTSRHPLHCHVMPSAGSAPGRHAIGSRCAHALASRVPGGPRTYALPQRPKQGNIGLCTYWAHMCEMKLWKPTIFSFIPIYSHVRARFKDEIVLKSSFVKRNNSQLLMI